MTGIGIPLYDLLDPREAEFATTRPIVSAVNIPLADLAPRSHELPVRGRRVRVANVGEPALDAVAWLQANGRDAYIANDIAYATESEKFLRGRLWSPTVFLSDVATRLPPGFALDVACGAGRDAVYLASEGWNVTAADWLNDALAMGAALAAGYREAADSIRWLRMNFESTDPVAFNRLFDLICIFRFLHRPLLGRVEGWLAPGGSLICETFTTVHRERFGKPARDAHVLRPGELPALIGSLHVREYSEAWREDGSHSARLWAVRGT